MAFSRERASQLALHAFSKHFCGVLCYIRYFPFGVWIDFLFAIL